MHQTITELAEVDSVRSPLSTKSFLLVLTVLALSLGSLDVGMHGPLTTCAADLAVVRPAEKKWGFHAEWKLYGSGADTYELLTIVRVTNGGPFDRAGIRSGFAFANRECGFGGPLFGGPYSAFANGENPVRVRLFRKPELRGRGEWYDISR